MSFILLVEQTAPETPSANQVLLYPKSDGLMYSKDDAGTERAIAQGIAAQSDQETATSITLAVTSGRQHFHPSAAKAWVMYNMVTPAILASYGVGSVDDDATGTMTVHFTTAFSSANYGISANTGVAGSVSENFVMQPVTAGILAGECQLLVESSAGANTDSTRATAAFFGDL